MTAENESQTAETKVEIKVEIVKPFIVRVQRKRMLTIEEIPCLKKEEAIFLAATICSEIPIFIEVSDIHGKTICSYEELYMLWGRFCQACGLDEIIIQ